MAGKVNSRMHKLGNSRMRNSEPEILRLIIRGFRSKMKANGLNPISHGILDPAMSRGGVESTPPLENTLGGVRDQLCFYRIMNLYKIRQNPKNQTPSFENGALKNFSNSNFFALSEMRKNMVSGKNLKF